MAKLTAQLINQGLITLDHVISNQELLMSVAPIRIMVTGGVLAVLRLHVRSATEDVDFILDPNVDAAEEYRAEFFQAINTVSDAVEGLPTGWLNDHVRVFIPTDKRMELFLSSVDQNIVIYKGENLVVYASKLDWALESKLARIETLKPGHDKRNTDISDAVEMIRLMIEANGDEQPISREYLNGLNFSNQSGQPNENAITAVASAYEQKYGKKGIV
ncbi:hypothetical protein SPI_03629 [Niveomyces insectorum RCEF 264]|uniref:Uncharacterized protein n=1 Tax=Niveomyces insectorum RCEF 264 TaxID=1081102 RepID=A0A167W8G8_9HYPO|nr:hypothetical protein SPI_03629 [Niveomyces insectorum RCEF 264]